MHLLEQSKSVAIKYLFKKNYPKLYVYKLESKFSKKGLNKYKFLLVRSKSLNFEIISYLSYYDIYGEDIFKDLPPEKREHYQGVPLEWWPDKSKSLCLDIGVAPLIDDTFNSGKSAIKYYEYSANFIPGVYSDSVVYHDTVKEGLLASTEKEWIDGLTEMITNDKLRLDMAQRAYNHVFKEYNLADHYTEWITPLQSLLAQ